MLDSFPFSISYFDLKNKVPLTLSNIQPYHLDLILGHQHIPILVVMKVLFFPQCLMCVRRKK